MARYWRLSIVCAVLWTTALALMVGGTFRQSVIIMAWGGFTALVACIVSAWLVTVCATTMAVRCERLEVERLAEIMARCAAEEGLTTRIH